MYLFWEYQIRPSPGRLLAAGIAAGLTLATKFTGLLVFVIIGVLILLQVLGQREKEESLESRLRQSFAPFLRLFLIAMVVVALLYCGYGFPVWAQGIRYQMARAEAGDPHFYFLGELSNH